MTDPTVSAAPDDFFTRASVAELEQWSADAIRQARAMLALPKTLDRDVQIASLEEFAGQCDSAALVKRSAAWEARLR